MMYYYGPFHFISFIVIAALVLYPLGTILRRLGFSPFWSVLAFLPLVNLIGVWVLAFTDWPAREGATARLEG